MHSITTCSHTTAIESLLQAQFDMAKSSFSRPLMTQLATVVLEAVQEMKVVHSGKTIPLEWCGHTPLTKAKGEVDV